MPLWKWLCSGFRNTVRISLNTLSRGYFPGLLGHQAPGYFSGLVLTHSKAHELTVAEWVLRAFPLFVPSGPGFQLYCGSDGPGCPRTCRPSMQAGKKPDR
jgi:hypothetical protein